MLPGGTLHPDVLVVGAGVVGCSIALHARRLGLSVTVLERGTPGSGTSTRGFGLVWAQTKTPRAHLELTLASITYYPEFLELIGDDCGYQRSGGLVPVYSESEAAEAQKLMALQNEVVDFDGVLLDRQQALEVEPELSGSVVGATYSAFDGHLDPKRLTHAVAGAAVRAGVTIESNAVVTAMQRNGAGWVVETAGGRYQAANVVNCAGVWAPEIGQMVGARLPVQAVRGQILVSEPRPPLLRHASPDVRQADDGRVWMGTVYEPGNWELTVQSSDSRHIRDMATRQVPALAEVAVEDAWAGLRPVPIDGVPILGAIKDVAGQFVAVGHSGITLSPIEGRLVAEVIAGKLPSELIAPFCPERFAASAGHAEQHGEGHEQGHRTGSGGE